ncbi:MAG: response regulator transcription factor [Clostridia bacterium]|nr:response regulator transcription factor [Clostridia bacterium]
MVDIAVLAADESLHTLITLELTRLGYTVGDGGVKSCALLIVDADSSECLASARSVRRKKTLSVTRDAERAGQGVLLRPILMSELRASVAALLDRDERSRAEEPPIKPKKSRLTVDHEAKSVKMGEREIKLSEKELAVFSLLYKNRGEAVSREAILEAIGGSGNEADVYICLLRRKLEAGGKKVILTVRGRGYKLI